MKEGQIGLKIDRPALKKNGEYMEFNWADSEPSLISAVKDQGRNCSASHAFAVIAALEAAKAYENMKPAESLSEQQIIDCSKYNFGC